MAKAMEGAPRLEHDLVQILPVRPQSPRRSAVESREDHRHAAFECRWAGESAVLRDVIIARVDWGPFDVSCRRHPARADRCVCAVRYSGPARERPHLMASFWHVMERFPFYLGPLQLPTQPGPVQA